MELRALAQRLLHGESLQEKLFAPSAWTDNEPGAALEGACEPGRARGLEFSPSAATGGARGSVPGEVPEEPRARGLLLHAFANHELLAIELMALALLRFVDAPAAFRRGLVQTLIEEQTHLRLYLERMAALGVRFGDGPRSGFFWRVLAPMQSPQDYVAHMGLTFEQANLDYAQHYATAFRRLGDTQSAAVLETVLADEVRHVGFGARWFRRWAPSGVSFFDAHASALRQPLQIVRAKGIGFDEQARRAAGLEEDYIARLRATGGSKGRPAVVRWFNGHAEREAEHGLRFSPKASAAAVTRDLELVPLLLARPNDIVLASAAPSTAFLGSLRAAGFSLPRVCEAELHRSPWPAPSSLGAIEGLEPWGVSPRTAAFAATARARLVAGSVDRSTWSPQWRSLYDKRTAAVLLGKLLESGEDSWCPKETVPQVAETIAALETCSDSLGASRVVVKPCFGASGRGQLRAEVPWNDADRAQAGALLRSGPVVVEPYYDVVAQLSIRLRVTRSKTAVEGVGRCLSDARGQFRAAVVGPYDLGLAPEVRRWLSGDGRDPKRVSRMSEAVATVVHDAAAERGYQGPVGVDTLVVRTADGFALRPLVDLNPRCTMGAVGHALRRHIGRRCMGLWQLVTRADLRAWGWSDFPAWAQGVRQEAPPVLCDGRISSGVVPTTDPARAHSCVMALSVAPTLGEAATALRGR